MTEAIGGRCGPDYACDAIWVEQVDRRTAQKKDKLESELNGYKSNKIKESIRMGYTFLGEFFYEKGELNDALKQYVASSSPAVCLPFFPTPFPCLSLRWPRKREP